jgi:hypothetical protein
MPLSRPWTWGREASLCHQSSWDALKPQRNVSWFGIPAVVRWLESALQDLI